VSIRALAHTANPPAVVNCAGPVLSVRAIADELGGHMGMKPEFADTEADTALIANDALAVRLFGPYRDAPEQMIEAAARWVMQGGESWGKPTKFGRAAHDY
jgi:hypothetical protein